MDGRTDAGNDNNTSAWKAEGYKLLYENGFGNVWESPGVYPDSLMYVYKCIQTLRRQTTMPVIYSQCF